MDCFVIAIIGLLQSSTRPRHGGMQILLTPGLEDCRGLHRAHQGRRVDPAEVLHPPVGGAWLLDRRDARPQDQPLACPPRFSVSVFAKAYPDQGGWVPEVSKASIVSRRPPDSLIILGVGQGTQKNCPCGVFSGTYSQIMCGLCMSWKELLPECCFQLAL